MEDSLIGEIEPVVESLGFELVEATLNRAHRLAHVRVVIYRRDGVGIEDCTRVSRLLQPRLEARPELSELTLEVSSPGVDRVFKSDHEYAIFRDKGVRVLLESEPDWIGGVIEGLEGEELLLRNQGRTRRIALDAIRKARLDPEQEVRG